MHGCIFPSPRWTGLAGGASRPLFDRGPAAKAASAKIKRTEVGSRPVSRVLSWAIIPLGLTSP
jgi:hypothetical protein